MVVATLMRQFVLDLVPGQSVWPVIDFTMKPYDFEAQVVAAELLTLELAQNPRIRGSKNAPGKLAAENHTPECGTLQPTMPGRRRG